MEQSDQAEYWRGGGLFSDGFGQRKGLSLEVTPEQRPD